MQKSPLQIARQSYQPRRCPRQTGKPASAGRGDTSRVMKTSLDLNVKWRALLHEELQRFAVEHPDSKFEIICCADEWLLDTAHEIDNYLAKHQCKERLKKGGEIMGKSRAQFFKYTKKEVL